MLKWFKLLAGAVVLAALAAPLGAQQFTATRESPQQTAPKKAVLNPKYLVALGRLLARTDKSGMTTFNYRNKRLVSETLPNGVTGTYQYDSGKFTGIVYTDGRYIRVAYNPNGTLSGLTADTSVRVKFNIHSMPTRLRGFLTVQNGIAALRNPSASNACINTDDDENCTIRIAESLPDDDLGNGGWGSGGGWDNGGWGNEPYGATPSGAGEGEGGGTIRPPTNETPEECKNNICEGAKRNMDSYCNIATTNPRSRKLCQSKNMEFYGKCLRSCDSGDWSWLDDFNYIWE